MISFNFNKTIQKSLIKNLHWDIGVAINNKVNGIHCFVKNGFIDIELRRAVYTTLVNFSVPRTCIDQKLKNYKF